MELCPGRFIYLLTEIIWRDKTVAGLIPTVMSIRAFPVFPPTTVIPESQTVSQEIIHWKLVVITIILGIARKVFSSVYPDTEGISFGSGHGNYINHFPEGCLVHLMVEGILLVYHDRASVPKTNLLNVTFSGRILLLLQSNRSSTSCS